MNSKLNRSRLPVGGFSVQVLPIEGHDPAPHPRKRRQIVTSTTAPYTRIRLVLISIRRALTRGLTLLALPVLACVSADAAPGKGEPVAQAAHDSLPDSVLTARADVGRYLGSDSAPIWIIMVSDFECPYCKQWHDSTMKQVRHTYIETGRARMAYLNMPLPQHRHARLEAAAALCAGVQEKFWEFGDTLFARQKSVANLADARPMLDTVARSLNLNVDAFAKCRESNAVNAIIEGDIRQSGRANIRSTPTFFVGPFLVEGAVPWSIFKRAADSALVLAARKR